MQTETAASYQPRFSFPLPSRGERFYERLCEHAGALVRDEAKPLVDAIIRIRAAAERMPILADSVAGAEDYLRDAIQTLIEDEANAQSTSAGDVDPSDIATVEGILRSYGVEA